METSNLSQAILFMVKEENQDKEQGAGCSGA